MRAGHLHCTATKGWKHLWLKNLAALPTRVASMLSLSAAVPEGSTSRSTCGRTALLHVHAAACSEGRAAAAPAGRAHAPAARRRAAAHEPPGWPAARLRTGTAAGLRALAALQRRTSPAGALRCARLSAWRLARTPPRWSPCLCGAAAPGSADPSARHAVHSPQAGSCRRGRIPGPSPGVPACMLHSRQRAGVSQPHRWQAVTWAERQGQAADAQQLVALLCRAPAEGQSGSG